MFEFRGLVANVNVSSRAKNENAGFVTPQNKNVLSRKTLFTDKPKTALGDLRKNTFNVVTPSNSGTIEKTKQQRIPFQLSTPVCKPSTIFKDAVNSTPEPKRNVVDHKMTDEEAWTRKLYLSDSHFDLIFMSPPTKRPPSPQPLPELYPDIHDDSVPDIPDFADDYIREYRCKAQDDEYELPVINLSMSDDEH